MASLSGKSVVTWGVSLFFLAGCSDAYERFSHALEAKRGWDARMRELVAKREELVKEKGELEALWARHRVLTNAMNDELNKTRVAANYLVPDAWKGDTDIAAALAIERLKSASCDSSKFGDAFFVAANTSFECDNEQGDNQESEPSFVGRPPPRATLGKTNGNETSPRICLLMRAKMSRTSTIRVCGGLAISGSSMLARRHLCFAPPLGSMPLATSPLLGKSFVRRFCTNPKCWSATILPLLGPPIIRIMNVR